MIKSPSIYKRDDKGKIREWYYVVNDNTFSIVSGIMGQKMTTSKPKVCKARSQESAHLQALFDAEAARNKKLKIDYHEKLADIDKGPHIFIPQLAYKWSDLKVEPTSGLSQPKFDGFRCVGAADGCYTREGERFAAVPFIEEQVKRAATGYFRFDGELYNHALHDNFDRISSILRKKTPTKEQIEEAESLIKYYVYDCYMPGMLYRDRLTVLNDYVERFNLTHFIVVETIPFHTAEERDALQQKYIQDNYEGQIIRDPMSVYVNGPTRREGLIKRKEFVDEEFPILHFLEGEGNWAGAVGKVVVELEDGTECETGMRGQYPHRARLLRDKALYEGRGTAKVRYMNRTPNNKLRHGVTIDVMEGERVD